MSPLCLLFPFHVSVAEVGHIGSNRPTIWRNTRASHPPTNYPVTFRLRMCDTSFIMYYDGLNNKTPPTKQRPWTFKVDLSPTGGAASPKTKRPSTSKVDLSPTGGASPLQKPSKSAKCERHYFSYNVLTHSRRAASGCGSSWMCSTGMEQSQFKRSKTGVCTWFLKRHRPFNEASRPTSNAFLR